MSETSEDDRRILIQRLILTTGEASCGKMRPMEQDAYREGCVIDIRVADSGELVRDAGVLFKEYASSLGFDLGLRELGRELAELPGEYAPPGGTLLLAFYDGRLAGCVAMRPLEAGSCEMKRLFTRHPFRGKGVGRRLALAVIEHARSCGYRAMRVSTVPWMREAIALYRVLGFKPIAPYRPNPVEGATFLELTLDDP